MSVRTFALIFGSVFLLVGATGFVPGLTVPHTHPDVGNDVWPHALLAAVGACFGVMHRDAAVTPTRT